MPICYRRVCRCDGRFARGGRQIAASCVVSRWSTCCSPRRDPPVVRQYTVDLLVERTVLVEPKVAKAIDDIHRAQCLNYLKVTGLNLCLLLNFGGPRLEIKRIVLDL